MEKSKERKGPLVRILLAICFSWSLVGGSFALDAIPVKPADWQSLISHRPPLSVQIALAARSVESTAWRPLQIENAFGVTNLDFYGIEITKVPVEDGQPMTDEKILRLIRSNFQSLIDPAQSDFLAYSPSDAATWALADPTGAVMRFNLKLGGTTFEGGSVVVNETTPTRWRFTTTYSRADWAHPVSGTREFGIATIGGRKIIYTMAADRPTSFWDQYGTQVIPSALNRILALLTLSSVTDLAPTLLAGGDKIWAAFQVRMVNLLRETGGDGKGMPPVVQRPEWSELAALYHPTVDWLGTYAAVLWSGPKGEAIEPIRLSNGRAIGQVDTQSSRPRGVIWIDRNVNGLPDIGETEYLQDDSRPSEVVDIAADGSGAGMLGRRFVSPRAAWWSPAGLVSRVAIPSSISARFDSILGDRRVAGTAQIETPAGQIFTNISRAFVWTDINVNMTVEPGELEFLPGIVEGFPTEAFAANTHAQIAGTAMTSTRAIQACIWENGKILMIGALTLGNSHPTSINSNGIVVGYAEVTGGVHAFQWKQNAIMDIGTLGGKNSFANSVNTQGVIVGSAEDAEGKRHGAIWRTSQALSLSKEVLPTMKLSITDARYIDDNGVILAVGARDGSPTAIFLLPLH